MDRTRRANRRQKELLVERLHANIVLARGNTADARVQEFWAQLVMELNQLGCQRTIEEWQHVWNVWRSKIKTKARKIRDSIQGTGGGPAMPPLDEIEEKILEVAGPGAVYGIANEEIGLPRGRMGNEEPALPSPAQIAPDPAQPAMGAHPVQAQVPQPQPQRQQPQRSPRQSTRPRPGSRPRLQRPRRPRLPRPPVNENLVQALRENSRIIEAASSARTAASRASDAARIEAARIIAAALGGVVGVVREMVVEEDPLA